MYKIQHTEVDPNIWFSNKKIWVDWIGYDISSKTYYVPRFVEKSEAKKYLASRGEPGKKYAIVEDTKAGVQNTNTEFIIIGG
jgi:hypothetical protein